MEVVRTETPAPYAVDNKAAEDEIIAKALAILEKRMAAGPSISSLDDARNYLRLSLGVLEHEVFGCLWLDAQNRVIAFEQMFRGTITETRIHPREVVKAALARNAAGVVLVHNHPSGHPEPSHADIIMTENLRDILKVVGVRVLDHLLVAGPKIVSFAERGLI
jgi:DNA repair protein RadC